MHLQLHRLLLVESLQAMTLARIGQAALSLSGVRCEPVCVLVLLGLSLSRCRAQLQPPACSVAVEMVPNENLTPASETY